MKCDATSVLAYLFWHRPGRDVDAYERHLAEFHERLRGDPPTGFAGSAAFRVDVPWLGSGYEDWYLVEDWNALGVLNVAAVDAAHKPDHDALARGAAHGVGGVYELRAGRLSIADTGSADWSAKPMGEPYPAWEEGLAEGRDPAVFALWQRQLVLGPAPEYCLLTPGDRLSPVTFRP
jgi:hypothetical protein